jgi:hypothetical protein
MPKLEILIGNIGTTKEGISSKSHSSISGEVDCNLLLAWRSSLSVCDDGDSITRESHRSWMQAWKDIMKNLVTKVCGLRNS